MTKTFALVTLALGIAGAPALAYADDACMTQAMDKKLAGAAKTSFMTKCERTSCESQANGQEAARRRNDLFRQEVHQGRDGDVGLGPASRGRFAADGSPANVACPQASRSASCSTAIP